MYETLTELSTKTSLMENFTKSEVETSTKSRGGIISFRK